MLMQIILNNGNVEYQISSQHYPTHGGTSKIAIDGKNVLGVFVRVRAWLEPNDGLPSSSIDDVKYLLSIGADYYPEVDSSVSNGDFANANYLPGAGGSRFAYVTKDPKWFYMVNASPDDLSIVDKTSAFYQAGGKTYLTHRELIDNPPIIEKTDTQM
ncbi:hypothetical protein VISI1226_16608 [Vibrio sinaloensis DSM 21326]|uniref:Uncharacterized protein n=1 Tax=Vibrio sinaloensis DSM 21326 TaxID=945550 RepID=E8M528_PHOS4|nr:hypothetical protein [Vibrio sinaloensis]EGA70879.1 hypothetical protein VISI1226_16608 [Vibrio sinaloensis DSM 21326]